MRENSSKNNIQDKSKEVYVSKAQFSPLLNTYITTICTHYAHSKFSIDIGKIKRYVITCIDVDMNKYLKIKKEEKNMLKSDAQLPQLDRSTFIATDSEDNIIRMDPLWRLPFIFTPPYEFFLSPITGIKSKSELESKLGNKSNINSPSTGVANDPKNPGLVSSVTIIGQRRMVGKYLTGTNPASFSDAYQKYFFYFDNKRKGNKRELIRDRVKNSKWQITLLTLIFIMMVSGIVMCISYK